MYGIDCLESSGFHFCDIQYSNEHTERFKPVQVPKANFRKMLDEAMKIKVMLKAL